jgi:3-dehydroquinate synthase
MLTIKSRDRNYTVETCADLPAALSSVSRPARAHYLVDQALFQHYGPALADVAGQAVTLVATEEQKTYEQLTPIFLELLRRGLKRDGVLVVIGGGVLQDIGCFIASVLFRGLYWELIPTTLLAQADSCIGSKSSLNIGPYKNQLGTFCPPGRVLLTPAVLGTLPPDEIRSGLGEVIKLQLLNGAAGFEELMADLAGGPASLPPSLPSDLLAKWTMRSLAVKQPYIEADEFDRGIRNRLNYGHTFGHAYESATHFAIPHGIAVLLGILTATHLSVRLGLATPAHYVDLKHRLAPWHQPYGATLRQVELAAVFQAIKHDKKNTGDAVNCILTAGPGRMEKRAVDFQRDLAPSVTEFIQHELAG